ncbi:MAG: hypothetical protein OHK0013_01450 [Sandaracinaceae bacterium]
MRSRTLFLATLVSIPCIVGTGPALADGEELTPSDAASRPRILVLRVGGDPTLASALGPGVRETLFAEARTLSYTTLPTDAGCEDTACAEQFLSTGAADLAAVVELTGSSGICERVTITIVSGGGARFRGAANVPASGVPDAARAALRQAIARARGEAMPTLGIEGTPTGAQIRVDGVAWGVVPHEEPVVPGVHRLEVRARGHRSEHREINVGAEDLRLRIELSPGTDEDGADATPLWASGIGALALGVAGIVVGTIGLAMGESCVDAMCESYARPDVGASALWMAAGGALVIGGGVVLGLAASTGGESSGTTARLSLGARL